MATQAIDNTYVDKAVLTRLLSRLFGSNYEFEV